MLLAIETSSKNMGVALVDGARLAASYELLADFPHAVELPDAVTRVLAAGATSLGKLDAIGVDIGPGSFTGLRIGLAFAKALLYGRPVKLVSVPSLDVLAAGLPWNPRLVCPFIDAKQGNVYMAFYRTADGGLTKTTDYLLLPVDEALSLIREPVVLLGDGCSRYPEKIAERLGDRVQVAPQEHWLPKAATLARLAQQRLAAGQVDDPAALVPMYLYRKDCGVNTKVSTRASGQPRKKPAPASKAS